MDNNVALMYPVEIVKKAVAKGIGVYERELCLNGFN
jgi:hypothetical protein